MNPNIYSIHHIFIDISERNNDMDTTYNMTVIAHKMVMKTVDTLYAELLKTVYNLSNNIPNNNQSCVIYRACTPLSHSRNVYHCDSSQIYTRNAMDFSKMHVNTVKNNKIPNPDNNLVLFIFSLNCAVMNTANIINSEIANIKPKIG